MSEKKPHTRRKFLATSLIGGSSLLAVGATAAGEVPGRGGSGEGNGPDHVQFMETAFVHEGVLRRALEQITPSESARSPDPEDIDFFGSLEHTDLPPRPATPSVDRLEIPANFENVASQARNKRLLVDQAIPGYRAGDDDTPHATSSVVARAEESVRPVMALSAATPYELPGYRVAAGSPPRLETPAGRHEITPGNNSITLEEREIEVYVRRFDGSFTTTNISVEPDLRVNYHGELDVEIVDRQPAGAAAGGER